MYTIKKEEISEVNIELWLIRHGETKPGGDYFNSETGYRNPPLSEKGRQQAEQMALRCAGVHFDRIITSDLKRAVETAEYLGKSCGVPVETDKSFREIYMGKLEQGGSFSDYRETFSKWKEHKEDIAYPEGENGEDVWNRCRESLERIQKRSGDNGRVAIVCHGGTIRSMVCGFLGIPQVRRFFFGAPLQNCSVTVIKIIDGQAYLEGLNQRKL